MTPRRLRAVVVLFALVAVPWVVLRYDSGATVFVFAWGLASLDPVHVTTLPAYLLAYTAGLPGYLRAWPLAVLLWGAALAAAAGGALTGREDRRVTAGLLALAGVSVVRLAAGLGVQPTRSAYPTGAVALFAVAAWRYLAARSSGGRM